MKKITPSVSLIEFRDAQRMTELFGRFGTADDNRRAVYLRGAGAAIPRLFTACYCTSRFSIIARRRIFSVTRNPQELFYANGDFLLMLMG